MCTYYRCQVKDLKEKIETQKGFPAEHQKLIYAGKQMLTLIRRERMSEISARRLIRVHSPPYYSVSSVV